MTKIQLQNLNQTAVFIAPHFTQDTGAQISTKHNFILITQSHISQVSTKSVGDKGR